MIVDLKAQIEEAKQIEEVIRDQLKENNFNCGKLKLNFLKERSWRNPFVQVNRNLKFDKNTKVVDDIINSQRSLFNKIDIGFFEDQEKTKEAKHSKDMDLAQQENEENLESYIKALKRYTKKD